MVAEKALGQVGQVPSQVDQETNRRPQLANLLEDPSLGFRLKFRKSHPSKNPFEQSQLIGLETFSRCHFETAVLPI